MSTGTPIVPGGPGTPAPIFIKPEPPPPHWHALTPHIKHVVIALVAGVVLYLVVFKAASVWQEVAKARQTQADVQLKAAQAALAVAAQDRQASEARYQATVAQVLASNASLARQIAQRDQTLKDNQTVIQSTPTAGLALRLQGDISLPAAGVRADGDSLVLGHPEAISVVEAVEAGQTAAADLQDTRGQLAGVQSELTGAQAVIASLTKEAVDSKVVLADSQKACDARVAAVKATQRKHSLIYSVVSFVAGVVLGHRL